MAVSGTSTVLGLPIPIGSDSPPDLPAVMSAFATAVETKAVMVFADTATRNTKVTTPTKGMVAVIQSNGAVTCYDGSAWQNLTFLTNPRSHVYFSSNVSLTSGTAGVVQWTANAYNVDNEYTASSSRLTANTSGLYRVSARAAFAYNATGTRELQLAKNAAGTIGGGTVLTDVFAPAATVTGSPPLVVSSGFDIVLTAGDYIEMFVLQNSGSALNLLAGQYSTFLQMHWISA